MKLSFKNLSVILIFLMIFSCAACSASSQKSGNNSGETVTAAVENTVPAETAESVVAEVTNTVVEAAPAEQAAEEIQSGMDDVQPEAETVPSEQAETLPVRESSEAKTDILVIYFSRTGEQYTVGVIDKGNTAIVAEMIAEQTGADLFEVLPVDDHYPMTYNALTDVAKQEQNANARPEYKKYDLPDLSQYETIFIGAPVWWGDWPMIMYTLFENNDFSGKKLIPFSTHEGSGLSGFDRKLAAAIPNAEVLTGLAIRGNDCQNKQNSVHQSVNAWLEGLGFQNKQ